MLLCQGLELYICERLASDGTGTSVHELDAMLEVIVWKDLPRFFQTMLKNEGAGPKTNIVWQKSLVFCQTMRLEGTR